MFRNHDKGLDHKDSGEKMEDACEIQTVFVGKSVLHGCHPWKCGEFVYIFAKKKLAPYM
jgi:hypothetical protein